MALLENRTALGAAVSAKMWDADSATPYFRWRNSSDRSLHELWFDDVHSFGTHSLCSLLSVSACALPLLTLTVSRLRDSDDWPGPSLTLLLCLCQG